MISVPTSDRALAARAALAVLCIAATGLLGRTAAAQDDPAAVVQALYEDYAASGVAVAGLDETGVAAAAQEELYGDALLELFEEDRRVSEETGEIGCLDFDPVVAGQDAEITDFRIEPAAIKDDEARVRVTFENFDTPVELLYVLTSDGAAWRIDDILSPGGEYPWTLSEILSCRE